jgi:hypothetical protein
MGLDITGIGAGLAALKGLADKIWPDKTEVEKAQLTAVLSQIQAQTDIDKAEAQSTDPLQHWRGGLGWVCVLAYFNNFIVVPYATAFGMHTPTLDGSSLFTLTCGMLGLGSMHVYQAVKG